VNTISAATSDNLSASPILVVDTTNMGMFPQILGEVEINPPSQNTPNNSNSPPTVSTSSSPRSTSGKPMTTLASVVAAAFVVLFVSFF
jgi:hypothetical protein